MAWYPVSVAMAWDMCTCAVKTNLLMENRVCELPRLGFFFFAGFYHFPKNYLGCNICWCCECVEWTHSVHMRTTNKQTHTHTGFFSPIYCFYSPRTLSHMASPSGPTSASQGLLSIWQKGWRKAFEHPINCHALCSVMPTSFIPPAAWHITSVPAHHAAICRSKLKQCRAINGIDHLHSGRAHFHNVSFIIWGRN